jgi:hypothetical protein
MRTHKPLLSIAAVAVTAAGLWLANSTADPGTGPAVVSVPTPAAATLTTAAPARFPTAADYSGQVTTAGAPIVVDMTVTGDTARAYVCDGAAIETWLTGTVDGDAVSLVSADRTGRIEARLQGRTVAGTLTLGERSWELRAQELSDGR